MAPCGPSRPAGSPPPPPSHQCFPLDLPGPFSILLCLSEPPRADLSRQNAQTPSPLSFPWDLVQASGRHWLKTKGKGRGERAYPFHLPIPSGLGLGTDCSFQHQVTAKFTQHLVCLGQRNYWRYTTFWYETGKVPEKQGEPFTLTNSCLAVSLPQTRVLHILQRFAGVW